MAKVIEFDLSGADEDVWEQSEGIETDPPKPGIYKGLVKEINPGFSKGDDGKPDKKRPRLEVIYTIIGDSDGDREALEDMGHDDGDCYNAWVWDYVSFSDASEWKQAQFFKTLGVGNPKKTKGKFNAEKFEGKHEVRLRIKAGTNLEGEYRPKVAATWPWEDSSEVDDSVDEELDEELDEEGSEEADEEAYTEDDLKELDLDELKELAEEWELEVAKGKKKATYIKEILAAQEEYYGEEDDEEEEDEEDDWEDDDEEDDEELDDGPTADDIREMDAQGLKALAKENGISLKGLKKSEAIEALVEAVAVDDVPF